MSGPRTKRQFAGSASDPAQRRITSFFTTSGSPANLASDSATAGQRSPDTGDASVQSNLLSVGMRVRKAVPEGYKTGTYSAFALWDESNRDITPTSTSHDSGRGRANAISTPRELLPFCGIHKVGGLGTQTSSASHDIFAPSSTNILPPGLLDPDAMDDLPELTLSQESAASNDSSSSGNTGANTRKRFFVEDEDEAVELPGTLNIRNWQDGDVSPRSLTPVGWSNSRVMAVPRKGRLRSKLGGMPGTEALGQENVMIVDGDFEEAAFLDRGFEVEMDDV